MSDDDPFAPDDEVWDPTEPQKDSTAAQQQYLRALVERLHREANWSVLTEFLATTNINHLNAVRRSLGLKFKPMAGMDIGRGPH